ncbi:MAG: hydroxyacylglutathione hydrolase [Solirubrobacteraceae bacterium]|jgi:rhodanese-related sulfurtransferase/glyoxylase-like metal-dependent hydrolase (beta-lactamase superfamily II)|nr:hydroxyacylglutathione hydrolase [Solirubrobacteraceae bacterium]
MILRQVTHDDLGCASYVVGDEHAGIAAVVDPRFEIDVYLAMARYMNVRIEHILETHNHADHVSGHGRLAAATGAIIHIHRLGEAEYDHEGFEDGWELELGSVIVRALHTPGHRPEHTAFVLTDTARGDEPWAVLSGDSLFVGDIARPDLAVDKTEGARGIFRSLHGLLALPDACEVWPGHLGGSMCGGPGMDMKVSSTIAYERAHNPLLAETDEARFVEIMLGRIGPQPPNFKAIVAVNRGRLLTSGVEVKPLTPRQVDLKRQDGALLVDVRTDPQFDEAHVPGAVCITMLNAGFGSRLAWIADRDQEIVLIGRGDEDAYEAARLATAVGIRKIGGYLHGGMTSWREEDLDVGRIERMEVDDLPGRLEADPQLQILDVRHRSEWDAGHIPGSIHTPYHDLNEIPAELDPARAIAVICASGQRAAVAASLLQRQGAEHVIHVTGGGVGAWERAGHEIERGAALDASGSQSG